MALKPWLREVFEPAIIMSFVLVTLGTAIAKAHGEFILSHYVLALIGVALMQSSVNALNDYHDYVSGVDLKTPKTPLSGGSKLIVRGALSPRSVYTYGVSALALAIAIGSYLTVVSGWLLLPILALSAVSVYFYTTFFAKHFFGEFFAGLNLGPLAVLGAYFVHTTQYSLEALAAGISPGIMISNVLLLNQFPDMEADFSGGRRNLVTLLGRAKASKLYALIEFLAYAWIIVAVLINILPRLTMLSLLSLPFAVKAAIGAVRYHSDVSKLVSSMGMNVLGAYTTIVLLTLAYFLEATV